MYVAQIRICCTKYNIITNVTQYGRATTYIDRRKLACITTTGKEGTRLVNKRITWFSRFLDSK
jgi:hypothetical protein